MRVPLSDVRARQVSLHCPARGRGTSSAGSSPTPKADLAFGPWEVEVGTAVRCALGGPGWRRGDIIGPGPTVDVENMEEYLACFACVLFLSFFLSFLRALSLLVVSLRFRFVSRPVCLEAVAVRCGGVQR